MVAKDQSLRPRNGRLELVPTSLRLEPELKKKLMGFAEDDGRDLANYIRRVLWHHIQRRDLDNDG